MFKIGTLHGPDDVEFQYGDVFQIREHPTWSRVAIGANDRQIQLMLDVAKSWQGPYGVLYVLVTSRLGHEAGRYQAAEPCDLDALARFAHKFREYFEEDGRHHVWFADVSSGAQFVYDNHDIVYAYGDIPGYTEFLKQKGFSEQDVHIPCPHAYYYHPEFDDSEREVLKYWEWKYFPLQSEHDDP